MPTTLPLGSAVAARAPHPRSRVRNTSMVTSRGSCATRFGHWSSHEQDWEPNLSEAAELHKGWTSAYRVAFDHLRARGETKVEEALGNELTNERGAEAEDLVLTLLEYAKTLLPTPSVSSDGSWHPHSSASVHSSHSQLTRMSARWSFAGTSGALGQRLSVSAIEMSAVGRPLTGRNSARCTGIHRPSLGSPQHLPRSRSLRTRSREACWPTASAEPPGSV